MAITVYDQSKESSDPGATRMLWDDISANTTDDWVTVMNELIAGTNNIALYFRAKTAGVKIRIFSYWNPKEPVPLVTLETDTFLENELTIAAGGQDSWFPLKKLAHLVVQVQSQLPATPGEAIIGFSGE